MTQPKQHRWAIYAKIGGKEEAVWHCSLAEDDVTQRQRLADLCANMNARCSRCEAWYKEIRKEEEIAMRTRSIEDKAKVLEAVSRLRQEGFTEVQRLVIGKQYDQYGFVHWQNRKMKIDNPYLEFTPDALKGIWPGDTVIGFGIPACCYVAKLGTRGIYLSSILVGEILPGDIISFLRQN